MTAPTVPAATVILVRDGNSGLETLMVRRSSHLDFVGGMWVFPGGKVDPADHTSGRPGERRHDIDAGRRAAVREAQEETGLTVDGSELIPFSHWTPPQGLPRRFATWFFIGPAPGGSVQVDGTEIRAHAWMVPSDAISRRETGEIELAPPTWVSLHRLAGYKSAVDALADSAAREPEAFETRIVTVEGGVVALYEGDAGYEKARADLPGPRHRLWMLESGWRYERRRQTTG